jgi:hypothetical protein
MQLQSVKGEELQSYFRVTFRVFTVNPSSKHENNTISHHRPSLITDTPKLPTPIRSPVANVYDPPTRFLLAALYPAIHADFVRLIDQLSIYTWVCVTLRHLMLLKGGVHCHFQLFGELVHDTGGLLRIRCEDVSPCGYRVNCTTMT